MQEVLLLQEMKDVNDELSIMAEVLEVQRDVFEVMRPQLFETVKNLRDVEILVEPLTTHESSKKVEEMMVLVGKVVRDVSNPFFYISH